MSRRSRGKSQFSRQNVEPETSADRLLKWAPVIGVVMSFIGGMIVKSVTGLDYFYKNVATIPYVDQKHSEAIKYVDDKVAEALKVAVDHSDYNRQTMMTALEHQGQDIKAQGAKIDEISTTLKLIQEVTMRSDRSKR